MWSEGSLKIRKSLFHYWVKHYDEPSKMYGIEGGRISKATLKRNGEIVCSYDWGMNVAPVNKDTELALAVLMKDYN